MLLAVNDKESEEGASQAEKIKALIDPTRERLEKSTQQYIKHSNKGRKELILKPGDLVWVHLRKERFPNLYRS